MKSAEAVEARVAAAFAGRATRADALVSTHPAASEPLRFAAALYRAQAELSAAVVAAHRLGRLRGQLESDLPAFTEGAGRGPAFIPLLQLAVAIGPPGLAAEARAHLEETPTQALLWMRSFWDGASEPSERRYLSRALLRPYVEVLRCLGLPPDRVARRDREGACPFCGGPPWIATRRSEGEAGAVRLLGCALCGEDWAFGRIRCPGCLEDDPEKLPGFGSDSRPGVRIEACETCGAYVKSLDLTLDARAVPEVDDLRSLEMDLWAQEQGYLRLEPGLAGL